MSEGPHGEDCACTEDDYPIRCPHCNCSMQQLPSGWGLENPWVCTPKCYRVYEVWMKLGNADPPEYSVLYFEKGTAYHISVVPYAPITWRLRKIGGVDETQN